MEDIKDIHIVKKKFVFKKFLKTSRGGYSNKTSYFIVLNKKTNPDKKSVGECAYFDDLSPNNMKDVETQLEFLAKNVNELTPEDFSTYPCIRFGFEMALKEYENNRRGFLFPSKFTSGEEGIPINGLIWMGDEEFMGEQIKQKLEEGYPCIKLKVGALDWFSEISIIRKLRKKFSKDDLEIRVDANGAFSFDEVYGKLMELAALDVNFIEQPIMAGDEEKMRLLCENTPLPIALDESLIGIYSTEEKEKFLSFIKPQYIILKPSLLGGFKASEEWITHANKNQTKWIATSALESNIGLNAISQWVYNLDPNPVSQGLGTGKLMMNNISSPLYINECKLYYNPSKVWQNI